MNDLQFKAELEKYFNQEDLIKKEAEKVNEHVKLSQDYWGFTLWSKGSVCLNPNNIVNENEKLLAENYLDILNNRITTIRPSKFQCMLNVITLIGMRESIDRDINVSSSDLDHASLGNSDSAEQESQTDLQAEFTDTAYARKVFSTVGTRQRVNETMKLGMLWDDTSFDGTPRTIKEAGVHWSLAASAACHARVVSTDFILNAGDIFTSQINESTANGTL